MQSAQDGTLSRSGVGLGTDYPQVTNRFSGLDYVADVSTLFTIRTTDENGTQAIHF